jgi:hypothetical protein
MVEADLFTNLSITLAKNAPVKHTLFGVGKDEGSPWLPNGSGIDHARAEERRGTARETGDCSAP